MIHLVKMDGPYSIMLGGFAWAPFVSLFIARISYGRSIKEFVIGVLFVPSAIVFIWMGVFGNAAIYQVINETSQISEMVSSNLPVALFTLFDVYPIAQFLSILSLILIVTFLSPHLIQEH